MFALCEQFWKIQNLGPLLLQKGPLLVPFWSPFYNIWVPLRMWNSELKKHPGWPTMPRCNQVQGVSFNWCPPKIHMYGKVSATKVNSDTFWWNFLTQLFWGTSWNLKGKKCGGGRAPVNTVYITIRSNMTKWLFRILKISNAIFAWEMNPPPLLLLQKFNQIPG